MWDFGFGPAVLGWLEPVAKGIVVCVGVLCGCGCIICGCGCVSLCLQLRWGYWMLG